MSSVLFLGDICSDSYENELCAKFIKNKLGCFLSNYQGKIVGNLEAPILNENLLLNENKFSLLNPILNKPFYDFCDVVSLANNHIFDQGIDGFIKTTQALDKMNINYFGAGSNVKNSRKPVILELAGKKVALLSYNCYSTNSSLNADASSYGTAPLLYDFIAEDVRELKKSNDIIIVIPHWGIENQFFPTAEQVAFARRIIDLGVDSVIGTHTHTIQVFEEYKGKKIYYSLGNFLFNNFRIGNKQKYYQSDFNKEGLIVELTIENNNINFKEYFIKFNEEMIPNFESIDKLKTPVLENNKNFQRKISSTSFKNVNPELSLSLKYNGRSSQVVYTSKPINESIMLNYETLKSKIKRLIIYRLRRLI